MKKLRPRLTFANVASAMALFVALGGSAYAATQLPRNSVGAAQLKAGSVTPTKLSSASRDEITGTAGPQGIPGPKGDPGAKGDQGSKGIQGEPGESKGSPPAGFNAAQGNEPVTVMARYPASEFVVGEFLPAGKYIFIATAAAGLHVYPDPVSKAIIGGDIICQIQDEESAGALASDHLAGPGVALESGGVDAVALSGSVTLTREQQIALTCSDLNENPTVNIQNAELSAIAAG